MGWVGRWVKRERKEREKGVWVGWVGYLELGEVKAVCLPTVVVMRVPMVA